MINTPMRMTFTVSHWFMFYSQALFYSCSVMCGVHVGAPYNHLANWTDSISRTVIRHFQSQDQYHVGDLIVRSQVAEIQDYMRKTRGISPITNSRLCKRVIADQDPLARAFNSAGNDQLLREAASQLGGYGPLDQLCQLKSGRQILATTIRQSNLEILLEYIREKGLSPEIVQTSSANAEEKQDRGRSKIYTVEDLLKAIHLNRKASDYSARSH